MSKFSNVCIFFIILFLVTVNIQAQEIFDAIRKGDLSKVKELVEKDPELLKTRNARQSTPLHVAVDVNNEPIARYLLEKGADPNAVNTNKWAPLFYAKEKEIAELLVEKGADINLNASNGTALIWSLFQKRKEVAEYLLEKGAELPQIGKGGSINLLIASLKCGSIKFLEKYIEQGFNPFYESESKTNLIHYASESNSTELIDYLISKEVPTNRTDIFGFTPLHTAALYGNTQVVQLLIEKGLDINARTRDGKTPYNLALERKKDETADYLKSIGADQSPQKFPVLRGEYMGQPKPGNKAVPFAPGIVSGIHPYHGSIVLTPDGNEIYWSAYIGNEGVSILKAKKVNGKWTKPEIFTRGDVPFISPDGNRFYFLAYKQVQGVRKEVIFVREKKASGWSEPNELPDIINSVPGIHWQVSVDRKGNLYFGCSAGEGYRIYYSECKKGVYTKPRIIESLRDANVFSPYIAPDGSYLIITKGEGTHDLIILFRKRDGTWTKGIELANYIGVNGAFCPIATHDSKYLFFIRGLGGYYIPYWIDASFIEELRPKK